MNLKNWKDILGGVSIVLLVGGLYDSFNTLGFTMGSGAEVLGYNFFITLIWSGSIWFLYRKFTKKA